MALQKFNFEKPDYLFCELPIKDGSFNDNRIWIYALNALSLIEIVPIEDNMIDFEFDKNLIQKVYCYDNESLEPEYYLAVYVQNNCEFVYKNANEVMDEAWTFFEKYLFWEDSQIH